MSILGLLKSLGRPEKSVGNTNLFASFYAGESAPRLGEKEYLAAYSGWVYACVNAIAEEVAASELKLQQSVGVNEWRDVQGNPAIQLLNDVNPFWSSYDLMFATAAMLKLHGNAFWVIFYTKGGKPAEIWLLDPTRTFVVTSESSYIGGYVYQNDQGTKIPLSVDEVIHFKKFNPMNPYRGMGTVQAAELAIDTDGQASKWQRNFFYNSAMPSGVLTAEGTMSQDQYDRIRANWDMKFRGTSNAHKMALLEGGLKFQSLSPTSKEMEFSQSRKDLRDEILGIFRVPKSILGITEDVNRAAAESAEYYFSKHVILPELHFIASKLNEFYLEKFNLDQSKYRFVYEDPVPQNQELAMQMRASDVNAGIMTRNEARAEIGLPPVEGGDVLLVSNLLIPITGSDKQETPDKEEADEQQEEDAEEEQSEDEGTKSIKKKSKKIEKKIDKPAFIESNITAQTKIVRKTLKKLEKQLLSNLKNKKSIIDNRNLLRRLKDASDPQNELIRVLFEDYQDWVGLLYDATKDGINNIYETSGKEALAEVGVDIGFDVDNPAAIDYLNNHALEMATQVGETIKEDLTLQLMQGIETGASVRDTADAISSFFESEGDWRSKRIARTETIRAYSQGSLQGYIQSGVVEGVYWMPDDQACPICLQNAGDGVIKLGSTFSSGDTAPPAHPNCECAIAPVTSKDDVSGD